MRIDEGTLRAYLDQSLSAEAMAAIKKQLAGSPEDQAMLTRLSQERDDVTLSLDSLAPSSEDHAAAPLAWRRFQAQVKGQSQSSPINIKERIQIMFKHHAFKQYKPALAIFTVVAVIAVSLSFAPVRAIAGNLLQIFRVQSVKIVPVEGDRMEAMRNNPQLKGLLQELEPQIETIADEEPQKVDSIGEADALVGFSPAKIGALPEELAEPDSIAVYTQREFRINLDKELLDAVFEAAEIEITLPDSLDEEPIVVIQPDTVIQKWADDDHRLDFVQMSAPSVQYPDDLDLNALGVAGLQLLGLSKEEADALGTTIDWANTLILPIPKKGEVSVTEVSVNDADGFLFIGQSSKSHEAAVMWTANGMTYFINGDYPADEILAMANSVQ